MIIRKIETFVVYAKVNTKNRDVRILDEVKEQLEQELIRSKKYSDVEVLEIEFVDYSLTEHHLLKSYDDYMAFKVKILRSVSEF